MPLIVEDTSEINVPPRVSTLCLPECRLHMTSSSRPSSILHIKACPCFKLSVWSLLIPHMVNLLQTEQNSTTVYMCAPKYLSTVCVALKIGLIVIRTSHVFLSCAGSQVPCISPLQYFSVLTILEGFQWTVEKTYDEFAMLHKSVSISLTTTTTVCW